MLDKFLWGLLIGDAKNSRWWEKFEILNQQLTVPWKWYNRDQVTMEI